MALKEVLSQIDALAERYHIDKPYIVGGLPRDVYMKDIPLKTSDIDITTNSPEVLRLGVLIADELNVTFELSDDGHLTVFTDDFDLDFSSHFISDAVVEYLDGNSKGLEEAFSRDFTINTLHQELTTRKIVDPTGMGFDDINNKIIRAPVPARITLTDDPRRAYRAVNLAARYSFKIDDDIKNFTLNNPDLFKSENVKDKYVAVKVSKALKEDEEYTLALLKELGLFRNVPLSGTFKDVLIERKMLVEYLTELKPKTAADVPMDWADYSAQSLAHKVLGEWWANNYSKIPGAWNQSYGSWVTWYMNKYRGEWGYVHKGPEETVEIMKQEAGITPKQIAPVLQDKIRTDEPAKKMRGRKLLDQSRLPPRARRYLLTAGDKVTVKPGVNIENITPAAKTFLMELGNVAESIGAEIPIITSGWRSVESQAKIMAKNWKSNGGINGGRAYLEWLYGKDYGGQMASIFEQYGTGRRGQRLGVNVINSRNVGSNHISSPGKALDISVTRGIKDVLYSIKNSGRFNMKIVDETNTASPHWHVAIKGENFRATAIRLRKDMIKKFGL
jgi:hypothetical protein